ncbi:sialic acid utilization regulator, RpiR family [Aquipluma nitroreducens]|uniref:Sialic acid utilization regulator, RpiR family n=1 Tax=Aquipluma nitroreducens TaxID=2010828 RepID=A0A5K7SFN4_9BACT|nr:MurR/RpiR family transcriptional regulator [Aquipluma nitroreducens]BBE20398.1 sialic acid utilization regulator, RpiR family [Aquipluma nitroreducens]
MTSTGKTLKGSCILRINGVYDSLKTADKRLADFILHNTERIVNFTIVELAENSNTSYATISRFCRKIGFSGFKELKNNLTSDILASKNLEEMIDGFTINSNASTEQVCERVYKLSSKILEESMAIIDYLAIDLAVEKLTSAKNVFFIGAGASGISARYAYSKFFRIGIPCYHEADSTLYKMKVSILTENDVLFVISSSGRTAEIVECARVASANNIYVISLSDFAISPLTKVSNTNLYTTPRNANLFLDIDMPLIIGQITIIDILYSCCCLKMSEKSSSLYNKTKQSTDAEKLKF